MAGKAWQRERRVATVHRWTGLEARALRLALRMSVRVFAQHLGLAVATVSKWEKHLVDTEPRPDTQAILDTALARADSAAHLRFEARLSEAGDATSASGRRLVPTCPRAWEYESWTDDLDRTVAALSTQHFARCRPSTPMPRPARSSSGSTSRAASHSWTCLWRSSRR